ncbi:DUF4357 domain-containing protein, partial [Acidovorax sp. GBBC 3332]
QRISHLVALVLARGVCKQVELQGAAGCDHGCVRLTRSRSRTDWLGFERFPIVSLRKQLIADGGLIVNGAKLTFTKDIEFASPSAAAGVVRGGTAAGPIVWINKDGKTLKQIEADA